LPLTLILSPRGEAESLSAKPFGGRARLPLPFVKVEDQGEEFPRRFNVDQIVSRALLSSRLIR
jgi:hypothetical protein